MKQHELPAHVQFQFVSDEHELDCICAYLGINDAREYITAALVSVSSGDYEYVYFSENTNFKRSAHWDWEPVEYYTDPCEDELFLQDLGDE